MVRIELTTSSLPRKRSTPELHQHFLYRGAAPNPAATTCYFAGSATVTNLIRRTGPHGLRYRLMARALPYWSGRRGSNPRPSAWKADALPTELLPQKTKLSIHFYKKSGNAAIAIMSQHFRLIYICGERWIRTTVGVRQQIYSLPHLATLVSPQYFKHQSR